MQQTYIDYWKRYKKSQGLDVGADEDFLVDEFGDNPALAAELVALVLEGRKTASGGLLIEYEKDEFPLPNVGDRKIVINGSREPVCVIEVTDVEIKKFSEVDAAFAYDEGEDDRSYESWHREHVKYFTRRLRNWSMEFSEDLPVVCERFRVVYR